MTVSGFTLVGKTFGRLTVVSEAPKRTTGAGVVVRCWNCLCSCGNVVQRLTGQLSGKGAASFEVSCGCSRREKTVARNFVHGHAKNGARPPEYFIWRAMRERCSGKTADARLYSERGITVCDEWQSFEAFYADMGPRPSASHSIDRVDNDKGYFPDNCRWATPVVQRRNQRRYIAVHGEAKP